MTDSALYDLLTDTSLSSTAFASYQADSLLDWSQVPKTIPDFGLDVDLMDLGFNPSLANDPTALHLDLFSTTELSPFPPQQQVLFPDTLAPRTMNITSSPSPGASLSSIQDPAGISTIACIPSAAAASPNLLPSAHVTVIATVNDPIDELAQFVRQAAGVTLAVPVPGQAEQSTFSNSPKLLIPRLQPPPMTSAGSKRKSPLAESTPSLDPALGGTVAAIGRRKTSHTTIERRYRTNLNTRTQSLKDAVPALRVLESKERAKKGQHSPEGPEPDEKLERSAWDDIIDGRGFVDGVKVARKISKGIVLGKAAEYIHVLKRREIRLKREQAGLRSLISGLVGGPALLREWEREWVFRFGGPERDEATSGASGDDGADDGESDEDNDNVHPKKRTKSAPKKAVKDPRPKK